MWVFAAERPPRHLAAVFGQRGTTRKTRDMYGQRLYGEVPRSSLKSGSKTLNPNGVFCRAGNLLVASRGLSRA